MNIFKDFITQDERRLLSKLESYKLPNDSLLSPDLIPPQAIFAISPLSSNEKTEKALLGLLNANLITKKVGFFVLTDYGILYPVKRKEFIKQRWFDRFIGFMIGIISPLVIAGINFLLL